MLDVTVKSGLDAKANIATIRISNINNKWSKIFAVDDTIHLYVSGTNSIDVTSDTDKLYTGKIRSIGFDYGDFERLGLPQIVVGGARVITFDHHLESRQQGDVKIIDQSFASTTELVYEFFKAAGWAVSRDTAFRRDRSRTPRVAGCRVRAD